MNWRFNLIPPERSLCLIPSSSQICQIPIRSKVSSTPSQSIINDRNNKKGGRDWDSKSKTKLKSGITIIPYTQAKLITPDNIPVNNTSENNNQEAFHMHATNRTQLSSLFPAEPSTQRPSTGLRLHRLWNMHSFIHHYSSSQRSQKSWLEHLFTCGTNWQVLYIHFTYLTVVGLTDQ